MNNQGKLTSRIRLRESLKLKDTVDTKVEEYVTLIGKSVVTLLGVISASDWIAQSRFDGYDAFNLGVMAAIGTGFHYIGKHAAKKGMEFDPNYRRVTAANICSDIKNYYRAHRS